MKRAKIETHSAAGMKEVSAYLVDDVEGLAVHRAVGGQGFSVTHVPSGQRAHALPFPTQASAVEYAELVGALFDFTLGKHEIQAEMRDDPDAHALVLQLEAGVRNAHMNRKAKALTPTQEPARS